MNRLLKGLLPFLLVWSFLPFAVAQTVEAPKTANDYYQSALQSYLAGDFDQAILWDSKALQIDPQDKKAVALLSILVSEKDTANKTVIWIGGKPSVVENPVPVVSVPAPVTVVKEKTVRPAGTNDNRKLQELETRIQTVAFMMERDSESQYRELNGAQNQTTQRLNDISLHLKDLSWVMGISDSLFLLALLIAILALWKSWKTSWEIKKQLKASNTHARDEEKGRVIKINRA